MRRARTEAELSYDFFLSEVIAIVTSPIFLRASHKPELSARHLGASPRRRGIQLTIRRSGNFVTPPVPHLLVRFVLATTSYKHQQLERLIHRTRRAER